MSIDTVHPGHGNSFSGVEERIREIRAHHELKKEALQKFLTARPKTTFEVCSDIIGNAAANWDDWEKFMALNDTYVYIQALKHEGVIQETIQGGVLCYSVG
jgi:glyoxylase-like metal-dependent hydrolase (beta-lactamase superfamily II)